MITSTRLGQWETNSSGIHQICVANSFDTNEVMNLTIKFDREINDKDYRDRMKINDPQMKLNYIVSCLVWHQDCYPINGIMNLYRLQECLENIGAKVTIDWNSFKYKCEYMPLFANELQDAVIDWVENMKYDIIRNFLFNKDSYYASDKNFCYYDDDELSPVKNYYGNPPEGFIVITDDV